MNANTLNPVGASLEAITPQSNLNPSRPSVSRRALSAWLLLTAVAFAVPASITSPVDGNIVLTWRAIEGAWSFNQHRSGGHSPTGGVGVVGNRADDTYAWDANLMLNGNINADMGQPVYAIADGYIDTSIIGWGGSSSGQILLRHTDANGSTYYSGSVHLTGLTDRVHGRFVRAGTILGRVSTVGADNDHLHFAVYDLINRVVAGRNQPTLVSRNTTINPTTAAARTNRPPVLNSIVLAQSGGDVTIGLRASDPDGNAMLFDAVLADRNGNGLGIRQVRSVRFGWGTATFPRASLGSLWPFTTYTLNLTLVDSVGARSVVSRAVTFTYNPWLSGSGSLAMDHYANGNEGTMGYWTGRFGQDATFDYRAYSTGNQLAQRRGSNDVWVFSGGRWTFAQTW